MYINDIKKKKILYNYGLLTKNIYTHFFILLLYFLFDSFIRWL